MNIFCDSSVAITHSPFAFAYSRTTATSESITIIKDDIVIDVNRKTALFCQLLNVHIKIMYSNLKYVIKLHDDNIGIAYYGIGIERFCHT